MGTHIRKTKSPIVFALTMIASSLFLSSCISSGQSLNSDPQTEIASETFDEPDDIDTIRPEDVINRSKDHVTRTGEIYLLRGLANVFSRGIDTMGENMRERGVDASNFSYKYWRPIARDMVRRKRRGTMSSPIVIIGHSLGANESSKFANFLGSRGVKVTLIVSFDPVETGYVGKNIGEVVNYYLPKTDDNRILAKTGFTGTIRNLDVTSNDEITHTNIEKRDLFQNRVMNEIIELTRPLEVRAGYQTNANQSLYSKQG